MMSRIRNFGDLMDFRERLLRELNAGRISRRLYRLRVRRAARALEEFIGVQVLPTRQPENHEEAP